jgi:hypothetical protein
MSTGLRMGLWENAQREVRIIRVIFVSVKRRGHNSSSDPCLQVQQKKAQDQFGLGPSSTD